MINDSIQKIQENKMNPCVSVIIPTHRLSHERASDPIEVEKILKQVNDNLLFKYGKESASEIGSKLQSLAGSIDYNHNLDGVGFFVSPEVSEVVHFPFPVKEKVMVGERFELRDLMYMSALLDDYFLLSLTMDGARLYKGNGSKLNEIINKEFPRTFEDDYIYEKPSQSSGSFNQLKDVEKDKSIVTEERFQKFLKETDKYLEPYLLEKSPLVIAGVAKELGYFKKVSKHHSQIAGEIAGNYSKGDIHVFGQLAFEQFKKHREKVIDVEIEKLREAIGRRLAVTGMHEVWKAAQEGKGLTLLVEKDLIKPGFVKTGDIFNLHLTPPVDKHEILSDAVEAIIETVIAKNGNVMMVENGKLTDFDQIALIQRYP